MWWKTLIKFLFEKGASVVYDLASAIKFKKKKMQHYKNYIITFA